MAARCRNDEEHHYNIIDSLRIIEKCQCYFNFDSVSDIIAKRTHTFFMTTPTVCCVVYAMHGLDYFVS